MAGMGAGTSEDKRPQSWPGQDWKNPNKQPASPGHKGLQDFLGQWVSQVIWVFKDVI